MPIVDQNDAAVVKREAAQPRASSCTIQPHSQRPVAARDSAQKAQLKSLIRDFANEAVSSGVEVEAESKALGEVRRKVSLRMDRRLSRLELWPCDIGSSVAADAGSSSDSYHQQADVKGRGANKATAALTVQLSLVADIVSAPLATIVAAATEAATGQEGCAGSIPPVAQAAQSSMSMAELTLMLRDGRPELRLLFNSAAARDRAYTCLRIFHMSLAHQPDVCDTSSTTTGVGTLASSPSLINDG